MVLSDNGKTSRYTYNASGERIVKSLGIAPGVPTMKGSYGDPENTGVGYNSILTELGKHDVPENWIQLPKNDGKGNSTGSGASATPGVPIAWEDPSNPENAQPGYGYVAGDTTELEETFYYHSDHLGSTSYVTDGNGNITQYDAYLPYGELLVDEHSSSEDLPYKFNSKQFDEETGLYYYGARYMNPVTSLWYGVDPLAEKFPAESVHTYTHNNPVKFIDPNGKVAWIAVGAFAGGLINAGIAAYQGKPAREIAGAALSGAVSGALIASGAGFVATAAGGTVASLGETLIGKGHINKRDIAESVVSNVVSVGVGTEVGKIIEKRATKLTAKVANKYASSVVRQAFRKEVKSEIKRTLGTTSGKYAKQLANRMVNRRVSVNRQFDSHLVLFGKNAANYPVQTAIGIAAGKMTPSMFSYSYSTYKRSTSNGKRF